jgi:hypothetical protein
VEKLGDYMFKIEFFKEEDMVRVLEGGGHGGIKEMLYW